MAGSPYSDASVSDFLNPKSMLTPGLSGILVMTLANSISFAIALNPIYLALGLSFLVGTLIFQSTGTKWISGVYYVLNSLIIFNMALGGNTVGLQLSRGDVASLSIVPPAVAQPYDRQQQLLDQQKKLIDKLGAARDDATRQRLLAEIERINRAIAEARLTAQTSPEVSATRGFFKPWKF